MSFDRTIWWTDPFEDPSLLPRHEKWTVEGWCGSYKTRSWHVGSGPSDRVLSKDIPDAVASVLPGNQHVVQALLSPLGASKAGQDLQRRFARVVAKYARGVILDDRQGTFELPRGLKRCIRPKRAREEPLAWLTMSWWMAHDWLLDEDGLDDLRRPRAL